MSALILTPSVISNLISKSDNGLKESKSDSLMKPVWLRLPEEHSSQDHSTSAAGGTGNSNADQNPVHSRLEEHMSGTLAASKELSQYYKTKFEEEKATREAAVKKMEDSYDELHHERNARRQLEDQLAELRHALAVEQKKNREIFEALDEVLKTTSIEVEETTQ